MLPEERQPAEPVLLVRAQPGLQPGGGLGPADSADRQQALDLLPVPATLVITPAADTWRTTLLNVSAIRNPPSGVAATPMGLLSSASVAGPSSPVSPGCRFPRPG